MKDVLAFLKKFYPQGFYYKDLVLSTQWDAATVSLLTDPLVLHLKCSDVPGVVEQLMKQGLPPTTPCLALLDGDRRIKADLATIVTLLRPTSEETLWLLIAEDTERIFQGRLYGKRIWITRAKKQAAELTRLLEREGASVYEVPAIEIVLLADGVEKLRAELSRLHQYSWLLLTSTNTVSILDQILTEEELSWNTAGVSIACIGSATAHAVREKGGTVSLVPPAFQAERLAEELIRRNVQGAKILLPRAAGSRPVLPEMLRQGGALVEEIHIYRAELPAQGKEKIRQLLKENLPDFITFTSSSTVHHFIEMAGIDTLQQIKIASIGPITTATLKTYGLSPAVEAREFTMAGLVEALCNQE